MARGKKVRCQWLDEMKEGANGPFVRSRLVSMEVAHGVRFDTFAWLRASRMHQGHHLKSCVNQEHERKTLTCTCTKRHQRCVLACTALPEDEPIAMYSPRGEEKAGYMWQMKRAMYGTRRASRLFQEHMKGVLKEARYAALKVCHQVYHCLETDSMAAVHGDDIIRGRRTREIGSSG